MIDHHPKLKSTWLIFIGTNLFFQVEDIGTPFMVYATPKEIVEEKNANIFRTKYQNYKDVFEKGKC